MAVKTFGIGLDPILGDLRNIDLFAAEHGMSRSEAIRFLIRNHTCGPSPFIHNLPVIKITGNPMPKETRYDASSVTIIDTVMLLMGVPFDMAVNELLHIAAKRVRSKQAIPFHPPKTDDNADE